MAERRTLTPSETQAAARFDAALLASPYSPESLARAIGVTSPAIGHWRRGEVTIPLRRAAHIAKLLGVQPGSICVEWATFIDPHVRGAPSQPLGLDSVKLATSIAALRQVAKSQGVPYDPETHPAETIAAYQLAEALLASPSQADVIDFGARVADILRRRAEGKKDGGQGADGQAGERDRVGAKASR